MLSVVLATHNSAASLDACLAAIAPLAQEIVIVDGQSTDQTLEIARKYQAKIIRTTNKPNFHLNKQQAIEAAHGQLILQLDADEVVDEELAKFVSELTKKITQNPAQITPSAWWLKRKNYFLGRWLSKGGQYPDPVIRLFKAGQAYLPAKDVHEQMVVKGELATAPGHLLHYSNPSFADYWLKFNRYTSFQAQQLHHQGLKITLLSSLNYLLIKPALTFVSLFFRHRGYVDGWPGFIFALFSGLHHHVTYLKLWELSTHERPS